jgi:putative nucleotidyltransferase with HDIG domain
MSRRPAQTAFLAAVCVLGGVVLCLSLVQLASTPHPIAWTCFAVLAIVAGRFALAIPGVSVRLSLTDTFFITSAVLFGPAPATISIALDSLIITLEHPNLRRWDRALFNVTGTGLSLWAGIQTFFLLTGSGPVYDSGTPADAIIAPLAGLVTVYFGFNSGLTAIAIGLERRQSPLQVWHRHFAKISLNFFAAASAAYFLVVVVQYVSLMAVAAVIPLFAILHVAMQSFLGRMADAERHVAQVDRLYLSTIEALSTAIEAKDGVTSSHIHRVQHYAMGLARALGMADESTLKAIQAAALLHDTGKLAVPERILNKPGRLTPAEFEQMKLHVEVGADILSSIDFPYPVVPIVRAHHENWDGTGYPNRLKGQEIPIGARILSVVDCYDALTSDRPYRAAMGDQEALGLIRARRGTMYDPEVVDVFERVCRELAPAVARPPQLQKAVQQISRAAEPFDSTGRAPGAAQDEPLDKALAAAGETPSAAAAEGPDALVTLVNLARIVGGHATVADVASVAWSHIHSIVPGASCALFLPDPARDEVVAGFVAGEAAPALQGLRMRTGDRLSGWVAGHRTAIVNSDASLDLGPEASLMGLRHCLALPLMDAGEVVAVLSVYADEAFRDDQSRTLQLIAPHLGRMLAAVTAQGRAAAADPAAVRAPAAALRVVARG